MKIKLNTLTTFATLMITSFLVATYNESGDKNAGGMYLIIASTPVFILTFVNSITLLITQSFKSSRHKNLFFVTTTPILLLTYTLIFGQIYFKVNYFWTINIVVVNSLTALLATQGRKIPTPNNK